MVVVKNQRENKGRTFANAEVVTELRKRTLLFRDRYLIMLSCVSSRFDASDFPRKAAAKTKLFYGKKLRFFWLAQTNCVEILELALSDLKAIH